MKPTTSHKYEYMLAAFLQPVHEGDVFKAWPLHITLAPWFDICGEAKLVAAIRRVAAAFKPFYVTGLRRSRFGWGRAVPVTVVESADIVRLHNELHESLLLHSIYIKNASFTGHAYVPHVTKKGSQELEPGMTVQINHIALIKAPLGDTRGRTKTVVSIIGLS